MDTLIKTIIVNYGCTEKWELENCIFNIILEQ